VGNEGKPRGGPKGRPLCLAASRLLHLSMLFLSRRRMKRGERSRKGKDRLRVKTGCHPQTSRRYPIVIEL